MADVAEFTGVQAVVAWLRQRGVRRLVADSRQAGPGDAFVAWPGFPGDGRRHVADALGRGAQACLVEADGWQATPWSSEWADMAEGAGLERVAAVWGLKALAGEMASEFCGHPSHGMEVVAITGTNGKTSTAWWLAQALAAVGRPCGLAGTLGLGMPGPAHEPLALLQPTGLTTPDPITLQAQLQRWHADGVRACALEASSIGLVEHRLAGARLAVAVFTNLTQDHLDYHASMAAYWDAKRSLFDWPGLRAAVVHVDDAHGQQLATGLAERADLVLWTVSLSPDGGAMAERPRHLWVQELTATPNGMRLVVAEGGQRHTLDVPLVGRYNAANLLGVLGSLRALGLGLGAAVDACGKLSAVPGRMEPINPLLGAAADEQALPLVLVDYAHTPDAVAQALQALQPLAAARGGRLHAIVGCGGDRDATKRPLMAAAAEAHAHRVCLTSDNPRSEDPLAILAAMQAGLRHPGAVRTVADRAQAIASQVALASPPDVVLIAGKGHETTQEVAGVRHPFSDQLHALQALRACLAGAVSPTPFQSSGPQVAERSA